MYWFARSSSKDRRSTERYIAPHLTAYYWTGAEAPPHSVRDISSTGTYLVTEDRWHPGTLLMMTLQKPATAADTRSSRSIWVQSKVIRSGTDGVGFAFVFPDPRNSSASSQGADQNVLIAFSEWVRHG
jgi:ABC-type sugar transport system ATPase subunit